MTQMVQRYSDNFRKKREKRNTSEEIPFFRKISSEKDLST